MLSRCAPFRPLFVLLTSLGLSALGACSSASKSSPTPASTSTATLSAAYTSTCATCHGSDGSTKAPGSTGTGTYGGILKGTTIGSATAYIAYVRNPKTANTSATMSGYTSSTISDADLTADYAVLTAK